MLKNKFILISAGAALLASGIVIGFFLQYRDKCVENFNYINTRLGCKPPTISKAGFAVLADKLSEIIQQEKKAHDVFEAAVYLRDLQNGPVLGINEGEDFTPASLLKLPLAIAILKEEEAHPGFFKEMVTYDGKLVSTLQQTIAPKIALADIKKRTNFTVEDLIYNTIVYSDNVSYDLLISYLNRNGPGGLLQKTYNELGIIDPKNDLDQTLSVQDYSTLFRVLFNASYLNPKHSEKLLSWLAQAAFKGGLASGVPRDIVVAHKFGEREVKVGSIIAPVKQFHDCGIIYYPGNPYLLCIMTRGPDIEKLTNFVSLMSAAVYQEFDSRKQ